MFQPLSLFVGLRYVRARQHRFFVSFITWVSLAGVALGVAALIVVLSVMNGFESELRARLLVLSAHARVMLDDVPGSVDAAALEGRLRALPGVAGVAPFVDLEALGVHLPETVPLTLRGIDPAQEAQVSDLGPLLQQGDLSALQPGSNALLLDRELADQLGVASGDRLTLLVPVAIDTTPTPRLREFVVAGVFEVGPQDSGNRLALTHLADARSLAPPTAQAGGLRLRFDEALDAPAIMPSVRDLAPAGSVARDWTQDNASYFRAIRIEKSMMALILLLIVTVAAFNIVAMLVMVVNDKRTDIAILRTFGASPRRVMGVFVTQGLVIAWLGVLAGVLLGVVLAVNVGSIVPAIEGLLGMRLLDADVYYITRIPSELHPRDVAWIAGTALLLTLCSTLYPARRAAATSPADALRYE